MSFKTTRDTRHRADMRPVPPPDKRREKERREKKRKLASKLHGATTSNKLRHEEARQRLLAVMAMGNGGSPRRRSVKPIADFYTSRRRLVAADRRFRQREELSPRIYAERLRWHWLNSDFSF